MSRRITKQVLYGTFYLACWVGIAFVVYSSFLQPAASCQNNRQDPGEEAVDCGGVCANACLPGNLKVIEPVGAVRIFQPTPTTLELAAKIQNANGAFAAKSFSYEFRVFGAGDVLLDTISGDSYIYGGEVKYLAAIKTGVGYIPYRAEIIIENPNWVKAEDYARPVFGGIQDKSIQVTSSTVEVSGKLTNKDIVALRNVTVTTIFYSTLGLPTGISQTTLDSLNPEETKPFSVFHPAISDLRPEQTDIFISAQRQ